VKFPLAQRWSAIFLVSIFLVVGLLALWLWPARDADDVRPPTVAGVAEPVANNPVAAPASAANAGGAVVPQASAQPALTTGAPARVHPSAALIAASRVATERWSQPDPMGNRERVAILHADDFKYPLVRVVERWSGKTGQLVSRIAMVADHVLIAPKAGSDPKMLESRLAAAGFAVREREAGSFVLVSFADATTDPEELPRRVAALGAWRELLDFAEPDHLVWPCAEPNDPAYLSNKLWGLHNRGGVSGYVAGADIDATGGWDIRHDASNVIVAITDTGIRYDHEDLAPNMWHNPGETPNDGIDNDGNGVIDDVFGYNAVDNNGNPMDDQGHGSHCAGTIGASGSNGTGLCGVAWKVQLMGSRFLGAGGGTTADGIKAINYARRMGANVISASWGGGPYSNALYQALAACAQANIPFIAAAGNDGIDNDSAPHYPSSYDLSNIVAVAATDASDRLTDFSCYGRNSVDIAAPGWQIWSCYSNSTRNYAFLNGTSMATPHVSGAMALARAQFPSDTAEDLISRLYQSADVLPSLQNRVASGGRLNLARLLASSAPMKPNDSFDTPFVFTGDYGTWNGSNTIASREADEDSWSPVAGSRTLWFAWQAAFEGWADFSCNSLGSGLRLVVYRGDMRANLTVCADSGAGAMSGTSASCRFQAEAGVNYRMVAVSDSAAGERFSLAFSVTGVNDLISCATPITGETFDLTGSNRGATAEPFETDKLSAGVGGGKSVWYSWTAPTTGPFSINTEGSGIDTVLAVHTGDPLNPEALFEVVANDDHDALLSWSDVRFTAVAGTTYYLSIDSYYNASTGAFQLHGIIPGAPQIMAHPVDAGVSLGERAVFSVGATGTRTLLYQWFHGDTAIPGAWDRTLVIDPVKEFDLGGYHVTVRNGFGICTSDYVYLSERKSPPVIVWKTGDVSVLAGASAVLGVRASGGAPLTYAWTKDGQSLTGQQQPSLAIPSVTTADNGVYGCTVSNDLGSVTASMVLTIVTSPFESFTWARDSVPNGPIADLKVIDGKCYAVAGDRILVSTDGRGWRPWMLPAGFDGSVLAKHAGKWYCSGFRIGGKLTMAISTDGVTWQAPVDTVGNVPPWGFTQKPFSDMVSLNGVLVAAELPSSNGYPSSGLIYYSSDGINWSRAQRRKSDASLVDLSIICRFQAWGDKLYASGDTTRSSVISTSDGKIWQESALPVDGSGSSYGVGISIGTFGGRLCLFCKSGMYSTADGITWTMDGTGVVPENYSAKFFAVGNRAYWFATWYPSELYGVGASPRAMGYFSVNPTGQKFSAGVEFDGAVVCGTTSGLLRRIERQEDFTGAPDPVYPLDLISFVNDEFLAYRKLNNYTGPIMISGDARKWRNSRSFYTNPGDAGNAETVEPAIRFIGGRYCGATTSGWVPATVAKSSLPPEVKSKFNDATDGTRRIVFTYLECYSVSMDWSTWTKLNITGLTQDTAAPYSVLYHNGAWYAWGGGSFRYLYRSTDALKWQCISGVVPSHLVVLGSKFYGLSQDAQTSYMSDDGITWQSAAVTLVPKDVPNLIWVSVARLLVFDNKIIALVKLYNGGYFVFFSADGRNWFSGNAPFGLRDIAVGRGMLVGVTSNGGVLVTGSSGTGGAAPLVNITSPAHQSSHVSGAMVDISGTAIDPEGQAVTTECLVDGVSIGTTTGSQFSFPFRPSSTTGHVVSIRSRDPSGLVGSDELKISATTPQLRNDFESAEGKSYLPTVAWTSFGGRIYVAGTYSLYRNRDDGTWEPVVMPDLSSGISNIVAGNGTLIVQISNAILATRDGINWSRTSLPGSGTILFRDGWFVTPGLYSKDGFSWNFCSKETNSGGTSLGPPAITASGVLLTSRNRSIDGGLNWIPMAGFSNDTGTTLQLANAFGAVFAGRRDGTIWRSGDDGQTWQQVAQFPALPTGYQVRLALFSGRLYWGGGGYWLNASADGLAWQTLAGEPVQSSCIEQIDGRFVAFGRAGMISSDDGFQWQAALQSPRNPARGILAAKADTLLLGDTNSGLWSTTDGLSWTSVMPGKPLPPIPTSYVDWTKVSRIEFKKLTIFGGSSAGLAYSASGGLDWQPCRIQGGPLSYGMTPTKLWTDGQTAFAAISWNGMEGRNLDGLWRSDNGIEWWCDWNWPGGAVADLCAHEGTILCLGQNGELRCSTDGGHNWGANMIPALRSGRIVTHFDGVWIAIGVEAANFAGPNIVYTSPDGQSWTRQGSLNDGTVVCAASANALVVASANGNVFTATDRNLAWVNTATTGRYYDGAPVIERIGEKFCIRDRLVSSDGITWLAPNDYYASMTPMAYFAGVYLYFSGTAAPSWSVDGINWTLSTGNATLGRLPPFAYDAEAFRSRDSTGAIWETRDGKSWLQVRDGVPDISNTGRARRIVRFGERLLAGGTAGLLLSSDDDGQSWENGLVGGQALPASIALRDIEASPTEALVIYSASTSVHRYFRSTDGLAWTELPDLVSLGVLDFVWSDGTWLGIRANGSLLRSTDGGLTWQDGGAVPGVIAGRSITRHAGLWVVAGTISATMSSPLYLFTSTDLAEWTNRVSSGVTSGDFFTGHGLLFYGGDPASKCSVDGITWTTFAKGGGTPKANGTYYAHMLVPVADGYLAFTSSSSNSFYWTAPTVGGSWSEMVCYQNQISCVGSLDGSRLFLFGPGIIKEWTTQDLDLSVADPEPVVAGVGDSINLTTTLRNLGTVGMTQPIAVDAWLSSDRFYGDGNDVYLGRVDWPGAAPAPGAAITQNIAFDLPSTIRPGTHFVILEMQLPATFRERNRANNVAITRTAMVTIPQWQLNVVTNGNGSVSASQVGEYYPHKARVSFMARAGKGARFAGWGGDALGSLSESMIVLDSDKTVVGNFVSTTNLVAHVRGGGTVSSDAEGGAYVAGATANLQAVALPGWTFSGWSGDLTGTAAAASLAMDTNKIVTATFTLTREAWTAREFSAADLTNSSVVGPDADPDGDGMANWREWLRGSSPKDAAARGYSNITREGRWLLLTYTRLETMPAGYAVRCVAGSDLTNWTQPVVERVVSTSAGVETIEARLDTTGLPQAFIRTVDESD
jgi:subtilisin family serine protease